MLFIGAVNFRCTQQIINVTCEMQVIVNDAQERILPNVLALNAEFSLDAARIPLSGYPSARLRKIGWPNLDA
jgi:hypothetical protein